MKKVVITNAYGYMNLGDGAILDSAVRVVNKAVKDSSIAIHTATFFSLSRGDSSVRTYLNPYGVAIKTDDKPITDAMKIFRFTKVITISLFYSLLGKFSPKMLPHGDYEFIKSLQEADVVLGMGGGYFRTKSIFKDYFGLLLTLLPILIAHIYNKRILYLPMSYGNFASPLQEKIVFRTIKDDSIILRDEISLKEYRKNTYKKMSTHLIPDLALFDNFKSNSNSKSQYITLTARLWMNSTQQKKYEKELALFIDYVWDKYKLKTVFIPMVWNKKEEDDKRVALRLQKILKNKTILEIKSVQTPDEVKELLANAQVAVCTRMHSAILSTIVKTPFIPIAYEHKMVGFLKHLGLAEWNINIQDLTFELLKVKFDNLVGKELEGFKSQLEISHKKLKKSELELISIVRSFSQA